MDQLADAAQIAGLKASLEVPAKDYLKAMRLRRLIQAEFAQALREVDVLLAPGRAGSGDAKSISRWTAARFGNRPKAPRRFQGIIPAGNLAGLPALVLPCGFAGNLPVALQVVGAPFSENTLLAIGREFQARTDWHKRRPPTADGPPEQVFGRRVTANFFSVMGVRPILGRIFTEEEERLKAPVAVVSYGLWQQRYGGDPNLVGRQILMDGSKVTMIGVLPRDFALLRRDVSFWMPASFSAGDLENRRGHYLYVVGRLKPGVTVGHAQEDMRAVAAEMAAKYPEDRRVGVSVVAIKDELLGKARTGLLVLMVAAVCVLLIACANLAGLLLARTLARQREIAVRVALGAGRGRLVRLVVTEGLLLAAAGGLLGVGGGHTWNPRLDETGAGDAPARRGAASGRPG